MGITQAVRNFALAQGADQFQMSNHRPILLQQTSNAPQFSVLRGFRSGYTCWLNRNVKMASSFKA